MIIGTGFSGGGVGLAALDSKHDIAWGIEYNPAIAEVYRANFNSKLLTAKIQEVDPRRLEKVDILQMSPVCKEFSLAKRGGLESQEEISQAEAICEFLRVLKPPFFILENVRGYANSKSFYMIVNQLREQGYWVNGELQYSFDGGRVINPPILNSADYGVPQTRERLILRASKNGPLPALPYKQHRESWHSAIKDLLPTFEQSTFAEWQSSRLPKISNTSYLIGGLENTIRDCTIRQLSEPSFTITANSMRRPSTTPHVFLQEGEGNKILRLSKRAVARLQCLPDSYKLPEKDCLAGEVIGNGIPSLLINLIIKQLN